MSAGKLTLTVIDYVIIGIMLVVSSGIGVFFQFVTKKKNTNEEFLLAGKNMSLFPVILSLMATFMSATTLMGIPADMYLFGTHMAFMNVGFIIGPILSSYVFIPLYFTNDVSTAYEYLEKRFGKVIRGLISTAFIVQVGLFTSASIYAPALALSAVTNLTLWLSIITIGVVCTFYCTLGGMKAVLWADVFQTLLMFVCVLVVIIKGSIELGGIGNIFHIAKEGGRLLIPNISFDLETQYTLFNIVLQSLIINVSSYGGSQVQVQRFRSLKTQGQAKIASVGSIPFIVAFHLSCCFCGLIIYAYFRNCDPLTAPDKFIHSADQLLPYYITNTMQSYPGLPGLCIAGVFSASLSTVSSAINCLAAVTVEDFIKPIWPEISESVLTTKIITLLYGLLCIGFSFLMATMGNLIKMCLIIYGMVAGPNLGVFILAACTKTANQQGTILGFGVGIIVAAFLSFLPNSSNSHLLPVSNECKDLNASTTETFTPSYLSYFNYSMETTYNTSNVTFREEIGSEFSIPISFMWFSSIALLVTLVIGFFGSLTINCFRGNSDEVPAKYLSPVRNWFSRKKPDIPTVTPKDTDFTVSKTILQEKGCCETSA